MTNDIQLPSIVEGRTALDYFEGIAAAVQQQCVEGAGVVFIRADKEIVGAFAIVFLSLYAAAPLGAPATHALRRFAAMCADGLTTASPRTLFGIPRDEAVVLATDMQSATAWLRAQVAARAAAGGTHAP